MPENLYILLTFFCLLQGFENVLALSEWEVLRLLTTESEHENAITLEQFDEFEEFHLKCVHYVVAISSKGNLNNWADSLNLEMKKFRTGKMFIFLIFFLN